LQVQLREVFYMKKHVLLILSVILLLVSFAAAWYNDHLFNHLFILVIPIDLALLICFIVLLVLCIVRIIKRKEYINFLSLAVLALLVVLIIYFPFRDARVKLELNRFEAERLEIVEMIRTHQLQPYDSIGNVELPAGYRRLSSDGEVFVYQNDQKGQVICFWVFRGMNSGSLELVYSSGGEELIRANEFVVNMEHLKENWYYVETN